MKLSKKALALLLSLLCVFPLFVMPSSAASVWMIADGFNMERANGTMVIYTPEYGETTGTDDSGYEIIVDNNIVIGVGRLGNNAIPENGFVVSGHDDEGHARLTAYWLRLHSAIGDYCYYSPDGTVTISDVPLEKDLYYSVVNYYNSENGLRDVDHLVVYNNLGSYTGSNDWGFEVVCTNGVISSIGGNNNLVPNEIGSFVLSGHGTKADWLQKNARLGMSVEVNTADKSVHLTYDEYSAIAGMELEIKSLWESFDASKNRFDNIDYDAVSATIKKLEADVQSAKDKFDQDGDSQALSDAMTKFNADAQDASLLISESRPMEYRAAWVRPDQTTAKDVDDYVQNLYNNGINTLCIETLYDSCMIMPMPEDSLFEQNPMFDGFDVLQAYIDSCHKRNMELHVWLPVFFVGSSGSKNASRSIGIKRRDWLSVSSDGQLADGSITNGYIMLDPSNKEAKEYLLNTYKYIVQHYAIDSFQLDYIRYYTRSATLDMGYTETAMDEFEAKYNVRPTSTPGMPFWNEWVQFRADYISDFVLQIKLMLDEYAPHVLLAAAVVPDPNEALTYNYQDYSYWVDSGWLDLLFPMAYNSGYQSAIPGSVDRCGEYAFSAIGLGIYTDANEGMDYAAMDMLPQIKYNNSCNANGSAFFNSYWYLQKLTGKYLTKGPFRDTAITPTLDVIAASKAQIEYTKSRINDVIVPLGGMDEADAQTLITALDKLSNSFEKYTYDETAYNEIRDLINDLNISVEAGIRLSQDVEFAVKAYSVNCKVVNADGTLGDPKVPHEVELLEKPIPSTDTSDASDDVSDKSNGTAKEDDGKCDIVVCIIIVVALLVILVGGFFFIKKKKPATEEAVEKTETTEE